MVSLIFRFISSVRDEAGEYRRLLAINPRGIRTFLMSPYRIILVTLFTVLFLPHAFVVVRDINLITAYEVDPGSIIRSILGLFFNHYNMNMGYHSGYYGWTYFSINYFLLLPIYFANALKLVQTDRLLFVGIRLIFFTIGLASVLAYFETAKRILKHTLASFAATILFIVCPFVYPFFYFLHPETTGLLFLFLGILCFLRFDESKAENHRWYVLGLVCLVLSALSKQSFFLTALPVLLLFAVRYCQHHKISFPRFLISRQFGRVLFISIAISVLIFFAINPFAFIQPHIFITNQMRLSSSLTQGPGALAANEATAAWIQIIKAVPVIYLSIVLFPFTLLGAILLGRGQGAGKLLYAVNIVSAVLFVIMVALSQRSMISIHYLVPIYPFFVLNLVSIPLFIAQKLDAGFLRFVVRLSFACFLYFIGVSDSSISIPAGYVRLDYQNSVIYRVYNYIEHNIPHGTRVAYDSFVAIPSDKKITGCHYWQDCGTDYIEEFRPNYVIFNERPPNGAITPETARLVKYVSDHHFRLIATIEGSGTEVGVWKKMQGK